MIRKYQEWLEESEKIEAGAPVEATPAEVTPDAAATETPVEETPTEEMPAEEMPAETPVEDSSAESEIEKYQELDNTRREAIKAFKKKQEEFLEIPEDIRKNPVEEADKTKVETLKTELIALNTTMKDAIKAWDSFNAQALGIEDEDSEDFEP
jgi:hypothetical protein